MNIKLAVIVAALAAVTAQNTAPLHTIGGRVRGSQDRVAPGVTVSLCALRDGATECGAVALAADGSFRTPPVADGIYVLTAGPPTTSEPDPSVERALEAVTVAGRDVSGLVLRTARYSLRGKYVVRSDAPSPVWPSHIHVLAQLVIGGRAYSLGDGARGAPDGEFVLDNQFGPRVLRAGWSATPGGQPWFPWEVLLDGVDVTDTPTDFSLHRSARLEFVFSQHPARIAGTVVDADGRPVRGAWVALFAADPARWTDWASTTARPWETAGTFSRAVKPGRYLVAALPPTPYQVKPIVPPFDRLAATASAVTVPDRARAEVVVRLAR